MKKLATILSSTCFLLPAWAASCTGRAYDVLVPDDTGKPLQCNGDLVAWALESGAGTSPCFSPVDAICATVAEETDGGNCTLNIYEGGTTCDKAFLVEQLSCSVVGTVFGGSFDHIDVTCV